MCFIMAKRVSVTSETETGRNVSFYDNYRKVDMSRTEFVSQINRWNYENYHVRKINGVDTPVSNPDNSERNNLW